VTVAQYDDLNLHPTAELARDEPRRPSSWGALALLALLAAGVVFFYWRPLPFPRSGPERQALSPAEQRAGNAGQPLPAELGAVPDLDQSDDFVRALVRQLSSRPELVTWLASDGLVRRFTIIVDKIAIGSSPAKEMKAAGPPMSFQPDGAGRTLRLGPQSYTRYDTFAAVVGSVDTEGAVRAYRRLRPLFQQAFDELGYTSLTFDDRMALAIGRLVNTPVPQGDPLLQQTTVTYKFADPDLEALSPAQKHLMRMGPKNMQLVQEKLRAFARAAGLTKTT
jgi:Protein of unknown function (DUF3014)